MASEKSAIVANEHAQCNMKSLLSILLWILMQNAEIDVKHHVEVETLYFLWEYGRCTRDLSFSFLVAT